MVPGFRLVPYEERSVYLKRVPLHRRHRRADLMLTIRIVDEFDNLNVAHFFEVIPPNS